ncbi:helix-turn-helix transcriptional regulator [Salidesulfovibrio brasiliensis]|uniref:helix-turn-helix transcriptional regulator n=1 Tax=Salidesulfovibrio brasiliensis TaxID=221711 RepID=UPI0006CF7F2C|nr:AlpA family phage regulatory protein [Salidesulfovibrio brasiliensis]
MTEKSLLLLPATGFMRLADVLKFIPVSKTTWWEGVKQGDFPQPVKLGERITAWRAEDIAALIDRLNEESQCA